MPTHFKNIVTLGTRRGHAGLTALIVAVMLLNLTGVSCATAGPPITAVTDLITQADTVVVGQLTGGGTTWQLSVTRTLQGTAPVTVNIGTLTSSGSGTYYGLWFFSQGTVISVNPTSGRLGDAFVSLPVGALEASFSYATTDPTVDKIAAEVERALSDGQPADLQPALFDLLLELIRINAGASYTHVYGLDPSHKVSCQTLKLMKDWGAMVAQKAQAWVASGTALPPGMSSAIASISSPSAIGSLSQIVVSTTDVGLLHNATTALRNIHTTATIPTLRTLLDNTDLNVEFAAASGIALNANHCVPKTTIECPQPRVVAGGGLPIEMQNFVSWSAFQANPSQYVSFWKQWVDCQTCLPGAPPPPVPQATVNSSSNATVAVDIPATMVAGQQYAATFTVTNTGTGTWNLVGGGCNAFTLSSQNPLNNSSWGTNRVALPNSVPSGGSVNFSATFTAPATAGTYNFQWQMMQECGASFGAPSANMAVAVNIIPPAPSGVRDISDFNHDGKTDILLQYSDGSITDWFMNGSTFISGQNILSTPLPNWTVAGTGDFNGDGQIDLVGQSTNGTIAVGLMNGNTYVANEYIYAQPQTGWTLRGVADFNGDGWPDLLMQAPDGSVVVWFMKGLAVKRIAAVSGPQPGWTVAGTGDFNGDGKPDILWQNPNTGVTLWLMNGATMTSWSYLANNALNGRKIVGTGDFNGDGQTDILWQYQDGSVWAWLMNGTTYNKTVAIYSSPLPGWTVRYSK